MNLIVVRRMYLDGKRIEPQDEPLRSEWASSELPPLLFIMGLHRSGTTFLYQALAAGLPVAKVTIADIVFFPRLVSSWRRDRGADDRRLLQDYFTRSGVSRRGADDIALGPDTVEEYGWLLRYHSGGFRLNRTSLPVFLDLCHKLRLRDPDRGAILLKNPWDTGNAADIAALLPTARFVFIRRDPVEILNSELRNVLHFTGGDDPLLRLLIDPVPALRWFIRGARLARRILGEQRLVRMAVAMLANDVVTNVRAYRAALARMPVGRVMEVDYADLAADTPAVINRVAAFVGLSPCPMAMTVHARRTRSELHEAVRSRERELRERCEFLDPDPDSTRGQVAPGTRES